MISYLRGKLASCMARVCIWKEEQKDIQEFSLCLMDKIFSLHNDLKNQTYKHGGYHAFKISDTKPRDIHKASIRDRLVHHALYRILYPFFDKTFIADSYSCRIEKGTHKAIMRFELFAGKVSRNYISDRKILALLDEVIESFQTAQGKGLPLGNLTSQLLVNIYMNEFDQFAKHRIKAEYYVRYADDFVFFSEDYEWLKRQVSTIRDFLRGRLKLELHPKKLSLETLASGVDFLGWMHFLDHRVLRAMTKQRMFKRIAKHPTKGTVASYSGLLKQGNTHKLKIAVLYGNIS